MKELVGKKCVARLKKISRDKGFKNHVKKLIAQNAAKRKSPVKNDSAASKQSEGAEDPRSLVLYKKVCVQHDKVLNLGHAPKKVIERFGSFCSGHATLTAAIDKLLEVQKRLKYRYEFVNDKTTCELLVKLPPSEDVGALKASVFSLCEYAAKRHYCDVIDAVEELVMQIDGSQKQDALNKGVRRKGVCGLKNLGNTCFMNCIHQCLFKTVELAEYFISKDYEKHLNRESMHHKGKLAECFAALLEEYWSGEHETLNPKQFKEQFARRRSVLSNGEQHDAAEFFEVLFSGLEEDLDHPQNRNAPTKIRSIFEVVLQVVSICGCGHSLQTEIFNILNLRLKKLRRKDNYRLCDSLADYFCLKTEGSQCSKCGQHKTERKRIVQLPPVLIFHLNRVDRTNNTSAKNTHKVDYPVNDLDMKEHFQGQQQPGKYHLYAVCNHKGTFGAGHWWAKCKDVDGNVWNKFDDEDYEEDVGEPGFDESDNACILFYTSTNRSSYKQSLGG